MVTALIVIGVIAFLALDAFVIAKVLRRHRSQDDFGRFPVPGSIVVGFAEPGTLRVSYEEAINAPSGSDGSIDFAPPAALDVTVVNDDRGEEIELRGPGFRGMGASVSGTGSWSRAVIGTAEITEPGSYTITAGPELEDAVSPEILVGR